MTSEDLTPADIGRRIRVTSVARSQAEEYGWVDDTDRLLGQVGVITDHNEMQVMVRWDDPKPGYLCLASQDEFEFINEQERS